MKKIIVFFAFCILLAACGTDVDIGIIGGADGPTNIYVSNGGNKMYEQISADVAKAIMDSDTECVILDVREKDEFDEGHIPGAILIPHEQIAELAEDAIPNKDKLILVYCRSGRRSKIASEALAELGYKNIKEFGGIIDWPYDIIK